MMIICGEKFTVILKRFLPLIAFSSAVALINSLIMVFPTIILPALFSEIRQGQILFIIFDLILLLIGIPIFFKQARTFFQNHNGLISTIGVLIAVFFIFWQQLGESRARMISAETNLREENNRNSDMLKSWIKELKDDPNKFFYADYSVSAYENYWTYIVEHKSQDCMNLYARATIRLKELNSIMRIKRETAVVAQSQFSLKDLYSVLTTAENDAQETLMKIVGSCQDQYINK